MKKTFLVIALLVCLCFAKAQQHDISRDTLTSISERLNLVSKKTDKFNLYFNIQSSFDVADEGTDEWGAKFRTKDVRLEAKGYLTEKLFYRIRHRLNKSNEAKSQDNLAAATDILQVGYHFNDKFAFTAGKLIQYWGGWEYDLNPIFVYEFSDYGDNVDCFQMGAAVIYTPNENNEFVFQITDNHNDSFEDYYGDLSSQNIEASKTPLSYIFNWNGNLFNNVIKNRWAAAIQTDAKDKYTYTLTLGTMLNLPKFQLAVDYMMDDSDLDRLMVATNAAKPYFATLTTGQTVFEDVTYHSFIAKAEYQPTPSWNVFVKGMYETASVKNVANFGNNFRKSYGYYAGVEYMPFKDQDLRLFLGYFGRKVDYKKQIGFSNYDTNRVSLGAIYRIKAF